MEEYSQNLFGEEVVIEAPQEETEVAPQKRSEFNIFALTDAIAARNKRDAWMVYQKALLSGMVADEIFWRVMWGVKTLLLVAKTKSAEEAGVNPYVYTKNKSALKKWKVEELEQFSEDLVVGYHNARRGIGEIETLIEKLILKM